uniref:DEPP1 autophagy regulator n=1 Tax=Gadus morhua TaxID=8049 RepID=A0A8C5A6S0_GADMO
MSTELLWSLLLPTITETLEDPASPPLPTPASPTPDDYMASIQALARPLEALNPGPSRLQRAARPRLFSKAQTKHSGAALLPRGSPRSSRAGGERLALRTVEERDCRGRDPVDWLYGQAQMRT